LNIKAIMMASPLVNPMLNL